MSSISITFHGSEDDVALYHALEAAISEIRRIAGTPRMPKEAARRLWGVALQLSARAQALRDAPPRPAEGGKP
jgi:hypothetical protein